MKFEQFKSLYYPKAQHPVVDFFKIEALTENACKTLDEYGFWDLLLDLDNVDIANILTQPSSFLEDPDMVLASIQHIKKQTKEAVRSWLGTDLVTLRVGERLFCSTHLDECVKLLSTEKKRQAMERTVLYLADSNRYEKRDIRELYRTWKRIDSEQFMTHLRARSQSSQRAYMDWIDGNEEVMKWADVFTSAQLVFLNTSPVRNATSEISAAFLESLANGFKKKLEDVSIDEFKQEVANLNSMYAQYCREFRLQPAYASSLVDDSSDQLSLVQEAKTESPVTYSGALVQYGFSSVNERDRNSYSFQEEQETSTVDSKSSTWTLNK